MKRFVILLLTVGIALSLPGVALAQKVGALTVVQGTVDLIPSGKAAHAAKQGEPVQVGDTVRTRKEGRAEITFDDGTIIRVARSTEMAINQFLIGDKRTDAQIDLPRGKIQSIVPKKVGQLFGQQEPNRFEVKTPTATCGVRGTDFFTYHQDGISGATFKEGQGYFFNNKTPDQVSMIVAGQTGTISGADGKPVVRPASKEEMQGHSKDTGAANGKSSDANGDKNAKSENGDKNANADSDGDKNAKSDSGNGDDAAGGKVSQDDSGNKDSDGNKGKNNDAPLAYTPPPPPPVDEGVKNIGPVNVGERNIEVKIDKKITDSDSTPPVISLTSATAGDDATFNVSINEATRQLTYYLDGQKTTSTRFDDLTDGTHTFSVEARDLAGNTATQSYSWAVSTYVSDIGVDPALTVDAGGGTVLRLTPHSDTTSFDYVLTGESHASGTASAAVDLSIYNDVYAVTTSYEGTSTTTNFTALHYDLAGGSRYQYWYSGDTDMGDMAVAPGYGWGGWRIIVENSDETSIVPETWNLVSGGTMTRGGADSGYWLMELSGAGANGTSELTYLTPYYLGHGTGQSTATYNGGGNWSVEDVAAGTVSHTPLAFSGRTWGALLTYDSSSVSAYEGLSGVNEVSYANGILGGTVNPLTTTAPVPFTTMGRLNDSWNATADPVLLYGSGHHVMGLTYGDTGSGADLYGYLVGSAYQNDIRAKSYLLYITPEGETGYLTSGDTLIAGEYHPDVNIWLGSGTYTAVRLGETIYSADIYSALYHGGLNHFRGTTGLGVFTDTEGGTLGTLDLRAAMGDPIRVPDQEIGIWNAGFFGTYSGATAASWSVTTGGAWYPGDYYYYTAGWPSDGFWFGNLNGSEWGESDISGTFSGQALTLTDLYSLTGDVLGNYITRDADHNDWQAAGVGTYTITPLTMAGIIESTWYEYGPEYGLSADSGFGYLDYYEDVSGLLGAIESPWYQDAASAWQTRPVEVVLMGEYYANDAIATPYLWHNVAYSYNVNSDRFTTFDNGAFSGYVGGAWRNGTINGYLASIYLDPDGNAGLMAGSLSGTYLPNQGGGNSIFGAGGLLTPVQLATGIDIAPADFYTTLQANTNSTLTATVYGEFATGGYLDGVSMAGWQQGLPGQDWGLLMAIIDGSFDASHETGYYNPNNDTEWSASIYGSALNASSAENFKYMAIASGTAVIGVDATYGDIDGTLAGAWVDIDRATTGVVGGKIMGTFDPTNANWQAVALGMGIETTKFLELVATEAGRTQLAALSIPNVEIGRTTLTGNNHSISIAMNDVTFFAYRAGESPKIWATGDVNGLYTNLTNVQPITLSGTGFSNVNFNPTFNEATAKWNATVNGSGTVATHTITMSGNAAGTFGAGTLTGTASGVSTPTVP